MTEAILSSSFRDDAWRAHDRVHAVRLWLWSIAALVFAMIVIGGATRLTGSGLSITEWKPIMGALPPLSDAAWLEAFEKYRQIPQYQLINKGMSLEAFKTIFWWEWAHRFLGRLVGIVFLVPFIVFLWQRRIPKPYIPRLILLFMMGTAQGFMGWYMVQSGLVDRVSVSQYRLAAHLALAVLIGGYAIWLALGLNETSLKNKTFVSQRAPKGLQILAVVLCAALYLQFIIGAFVAGLKGGNASHTWPLMNGYFIPYGLDVFSPWYVNIFENPLAAQFAHRMLGYGIAGLAAIALTWSWLRFSAMPLMQSAAFVALAIFIQIALGVATVIAEVPLSFALAHQAMAFVVFGIALRHCHRVLYG